MIQQLQLLGRRVDLLAVYQQLVAVQVDDQLVEHQALFRVVGDLAAAEHRIDAGHELLHLEGLHQIVVRAHFQAGDPVVDLAFGGEHDDGGLGLFPDVGAHGPAVHHREHDIQQHQVGAEEAVELQGFAAVLGDHGLVTFLFQVEVDDIQQHHVRGLLVEFLHGLAAVIGASDLEALFFQVHADQVGDVAVVLHHQNVACHALSLPLVSIVDAFLYYTAPDGAFLNFL